MCSAHSISMESSTVSNNVAGGAGGGTMFSYGSNGVTLLGLRIIGNVANEFGGMGILNYENVTIEDVVIRNNRAIYALGGGLAIVGSQSIIFANSTIDRNTAATFGGGFVLSHTSSVLLNNTLIAQNAAGTGGGGLHVTDSENVMFSAVTLHQNAAGSEGGGAYIRVVDGLEVLDCVVRFNVAQNKSGGGFFVNTTTMKLNRSVFQLNVALSGGGGGLYWLTLGMDEPLGINDTSNVFTFNLAKYGHEKATESSQLLVNSTHNVDDFDTSPQITAALHDYYGQYVPLETRDDVIALLNPAKEELQFCDGQTAYLTGAVDTRFVKGIAYFSDFNAYCVPGGNFSMSVSHVITSVGIESRFLSDVIMFFRTCVRGEYYGDRVCKRCELGTYTLFTSDSYEDLPQTICKTCPSGAISCSGDLIHLDKGYWRIHDDTDKILSCPWGDQSCHGGTMVGDSLCAEGYEGPLCAVCADGYHFTRSTQSCEPCEEPSSWMDSYSSLAFLCLLFIIGIVAFYFFKTRVMKREDLNSVDDVLVYITMRLRIIDIGVYIRNKEKLSVFAKENRRRFSTRLRIYIAFYQILSVVPFVLDIDFPDVYTMIMAVVDSVVNFNISTSTVVTCSFDSKYDFIDMLYVDITMPIVVSLLLKIVSVIHLHFKTKKWTRKEYSDIKNKRNRLRSYYFLAFLLYTYMCKFCAGVLMIF